MVTAAVTQPPIRKQSAFATILELRRKGFLNFLVDRWRVEGDVFRLGPGMTFFAHPDHVKYVSIDHRENFDKLKSYDVVRKLLLGNGLVTSNGELWRRQRKLMAPFFTPRGIEHYASIMTEEGEALSRRWDKLAEAGQPVEMLDEMMRITASIIVRTMFSLTDTRQATQLTDVFEALVRITAGGMSLPIRIPLWVPTPSNRRYYSARHRVDTFLNRIIAERRAMPESAWPDDLLARLMSARDEITGETMPDQQVLDEAVTIFFAGHETTARTLSFTWYALSQNPGVADRLHAEIDGVIGNRLPAFDDLKQLGYTLQVLQEAIRLYPAAPIYVRDAIADDRIDGQPIAGGSTVMLSPFITHRHPEFWPDPEKFDPDRWSPERAKAQHPYAYHPFAAGQRVCIGNNFSLFESHTLLIMLGQRFAPRLVPGHQLHLDMVGTLSSRNGIPMTIERRG